MFKLKIFSFNLLGDFFYPKYLFGEKKKDWGITDLDYSFWTDDNEVVSAQNLTKIFLENFIILFLSKNFDKKKNLCIWNGKIFCFIFFLM